MLRLPVAVILLGTSMVLTGCSTIGGLFGGGEKEPFEARPTAIGVNGFLWRATLDTLVFLPLIETDVNEGVILSDWYAAPDSPDERVKVRVQFLSANLRADAIRVTVQRQVKTGSNWVAASVQAATPLQIEEAILTQARRLKIEAES